MTTETDSKPQSPLKSTFVPPYALQGQEFSCHVTWDKSSSVRELTLDLSSGLEVIHLYNVKDCKTAPQETKHAVEVLSFQEPGYLGFVLKSKVYRNSEERGEVRIAGTVVLDGSPIRFSRALQVELFRPELAIENDRIGPRAVHFSSPEAGQIPSTDDPVVILNRGKGTCIVLVSVIRDSTLKMGDYLQQGETKERFRKSLREGLDKLKRDYPGHSSLIGKLEEFSLRDLMTEEEALSGLKELNEEATEAVKDDSEFADDIGQVFGDAAMSIFSLDQRFASWATAIGSNVDRRMTLLNPWFALEVGPTPVVATFHLRGFDLQWHEHNQFSIGPLTLTSEEVGLVPACSIFQAGNQEREVPASETRGDQSVHGRG